MMGGTEERSYQIFQGQMGSLIPVVLLFTVWPLTCHIMTLYLQAILRVLLTIPAVLIVSFRSFTGVAWRAFLSSHAVFGLALRSPLTTLTITGNVWINLACAVNNAVDSQKEDLQKKGRIADITNPGGLNAVI